MNFMEKQVGKVIATLESPNTEEFAFVVTGMVKKGQYVFLEHQNKGYIALVTEIFNSNKYFERPETVMDYEKFGDIVESFPVEDWDYTVAHAKLLGMIEGERLTRVELPPKPGAVVRIAENEMLQKFLGFDPEGIEIGYIPNHNLTVRLNVSRLFQKHLAILAMSGSGKSYLASVLIEELLNRKPEQGRVCTIILDVHGEYTSLKSAFPKQVEIVDVESSRLALRNINASHFSEWYDGITGPQMRELSMALEHLKKERKEKGISFGLKELEEYLASIDTDKKKEIKNVLNWVREFKKLRLISSSEKPNIKDLILPGKLLIFDLSKTDSFHKKQVYVHYLCHRLFSLRKKNKICPLIMIVEEAHNFAKEKAHRSNSIPKGILETIAREGRKFGFSLVLITQRPVKLSTTALSQCNTNIILRITNPFDQKHIGESCEAIDSSLLQTLSTLHVGEAIIAGEAVNIPILFRVRKRKFELYRVGLNFEEMARRFENDLEKLRNDAEAFI